MNHEVGATIGFVVADIVREDFRETMARGDVPGVRIVGFNEVEIRYLVERLTSFDLRIADHDSPVEVVVGSDRPRSSILPRAFLRPGWTITRHRNENVHGLVLIELDVQGDETGVLAMHSFSDSDILDQTDDAVIRHRVRRIAQIAWESQRGDSGKELSEYAIESLNRIFVALEEVDHPSLRTWVSFTVAVNGKLLASEQLTEDKIDEVVSQELRWLNLFPDPLLFESGPGIIGRLRKNVFMSDFKTPLGKNLKDDELGMLIDALELPQDPENPLADSHVEEVRSTMRLILDQGGPDPNNFVTLSLWEKLFDRHKPNLGLGRQIHEYLQLNEPDRLEEYLELNIEEDLDEGGEVAATTMLSADAPTDLPAIAEVLPARLKKKLDRIAFQGDQFAPDPLIAILYGLKALDSVEGSDEGLTITLEWDQSNNIATRSSQLFAFLYRQTLNEVAEACDGSYGASFVLGSELQAIGSLEHTFDSIVPDEDIDVDELALQEWGLMRFKLTTSTSSTPLMKFHWDPRQVPGLAAFAKLIFEGGAPRQIKIESLEKWADGIFESLSPLEIIPVIEMTGISGDAWSELTRTHFSNWIYSGLAVSGLDGFLDQWTPLLHRARETLIPSGGPLAELDAFLDRETAATEDHRLVMLGSHPIRLRWYRHHLQNVSTLIREALQGELTLNPLNDRLFFSWLERVSPHRQPPVMSVGGNAIATSIREFQLHEEYALIRSGDGSTPDWLAVVDDSSIEALVRITRSFLTAFPQKMDGLSILLMARTGAAHLAKKFVERLRLRELAQLDLELHVVTDSAQHDEIASSLSSLDSDDGRGRTLLPKFRLILHDWALQGIEALDGLEGQVDVALAPNLFGLYSTALEETKKDDTGLGGRFDPWLDRTTHTRSTESGSVNVSEVLVPDAPDPILEDWSTLTVRRSRQAPVSPDDPSGVDYVTIQVAFHSNESLFEKLHEVANWVITLDPFIGRDQIDALKNAPDIILVKSDIGKNESYTLVVSSTAGRTWVVERLANRLESGFGVAPDRARVISSRLYEIGRHVAPGLMLRAVGLGRTTEEILGLVIARYAVDLYDDSQEPFMGVQYWLSLDEESDWFGGMNRVRPDLLRVRLSATESGTELELLVLESKFRQGTDLGDASNQIDKGKELFKAAFSSGEFEMNDSRFWRRELRTAVNQLSHRPASAENLPSVLTLGENIDEANLLDDLRTGSYTLSPVQGIICATAWSEEIGENGHLDYQLDGHRVLSIGRSAVLDILDRIERGLPPRTLAADAVSQPLDGDVENDHPIPEPELLSSATIDMSTSDSVVIATELLATTTVISPDQKEISDEDQDRSMARGLTAADLESRYQKILSRLRELGIQADRPEGTPYKEGPGFCSYRLLPHQGVSADRITGKLEDIKLALALPSELSIRSFIDKGAVVFEVPKEDTDRYYVTAESLWQRSQDSDMTLSVPVGEDVEGDVVTLDFSSSDTPHLLIAGQTGSGKTIALETILYGLCVRKDPSQLKLLLVDPKSTELIDFADDPHLHGEIGWLPEDAKTMLQESIDEMATRYHLFRERRVRSLPEYNRQVEAEDRIPWWLIVLDEYADLTSDPDDRRSIEVDLKRIAQKGRAAGIHLIVATQKPSAEVISTVIRSNLPAQLALRVRSSTDSRIVIEEAGAESLAGKGDAFLRTNRGLRRVQCAMVTK